MTDTTRISIVIFALLALTFTLGGFILWSSGWGAFILYILVLILITLMAG